VPAERALALVVRGFDWSETSRIITLFTREFGKVRALAKGGRRLKSNFDVAFDLLNVCHVMVIRKAHGGLDLLTEAQLAERFPVLRQDLSALYAGYYIAELLADGTQDYDPHPELFDAAIETLRSLRLEDPSPNPLHQGERGLSAPPSLLGKGVGGLGSATALDAVAAFELVWLHELGYSPRLDACTSCGADVLVPGSERVLFSASAGGVVCSRCGPAVADRRSLSVSGLAALRGLAGGGQGPGMKLTSGDRRELRGLLGELVSFVLGRRPRLLGYLEPR